MQTIYSPYVHMDQYTLYFWRHGALLEVPWEKQTPNQLSRMYHKVPCMRVNHRSKIYEYGHYTYLGWRSSKTRIPKPLKALQLILTD